MDRTGSQPSALSSQGIWLHSYLSVAIVVGMIVAASGLTQAETPYSVAWGKQIGMLPENYSRSVAVDGSGNAFISGETWGSLGGTSAGGYDGFLVKYDVSGNVLWKQQIGTTGDDYSKSVAVDGSGNAYISGYTAGGISGTNAGGNDTFLVKYNASGTLAWKKQLGTSGNDVSNSVAVSNSGNAYITGYTYGGISGTNAGGSDAFLAKYNDSGTVAWKQQLGTSGSDVSNSVSVDASGNSYISGYTTGSLGGTLTGSQDAFLAKYDTSGTLLWKKQLGVVNSTTTSKSVAIDSSGNAYICGSTSGSLDGTSTGYVFIAKYNVLGNLLWTHQFSTSSGDVGNSVAVDGSGNIFLSGTCWDGDNGPINMGLEDAFLAKYNSSGDMLWTQKFGSPDHDKCTSVTVDGAGNPYFTGYSAGGMFGPRTGDYDSYLAKFTATPEPATMSLLALGALAIIRRRHK